MRAAAQKSAGHLRGKLSFLAEHKLIDPALAARLGKMMEFRNLLIHGYSKIDDNKMLQIPSL